jgi:hypothetical protein
MDEENVNISTNETFVAFAVKMAEGALKEAGGISPHMVAVLPTGQVMFMPMDLSRMDDNAYKDGAAEAFGNACREHSAERYLFVSEAWMSAPKDNTLTVRPSEDPDRIEVVALVGGEPHNPVFAVKKIVRDANGDFAALEDMELPPETTGGGRFYGLLDHPTLN